MADNNSLGITMKHELIAHTTMSCMSITLNLFAPPPYSPLLTPLTHFPPLPTRQYARWPQTAILQLIIQLAKEKCNRIVVNPEDVMTIWALAVADNERHLHDVPGCLTEACVHHRLFTARYADQCSACVVLIRWDFEQYGKMLNIL